MTKKEALQLFEQRKVRTVWDDQEEKWYFSIVDVCDVLTDSKDATAYWRKLKQRLKEEGNETVTNCHGLKLRAADGKMRITDVADTEQLFRIIQSIPSPKAEPFKQWMAQVASQRLDQMQDPELNIDQAILDYKRLDILAEASAAELSKQRDPKGFRGQKQVAKDGGSVAKAARKQLENQLGRSAISPSKASDYLLLEGTEDVEK